MTSVAQPDVKETRLVTAEDIAQVALTLDALVGRLSYDKTFVSDLANSPKETLQNAGIKLPKEPLEAYIRTNPDRFDRASEALFSLVDSDFLMTLSSPSC